MQINVYRVRFYPQGTIGQLYINGEFYCFTLEDVVREQAGKPVDEWKVAGVTAIPRGTYKVTLEDSPKFGPNTLTINNVPGFSGIRIHAGNTDKDTEGCLIVGYRTSDQEDGTIKIQYGSTRPCVANLKLKVQEDIDAGSEVKLTIV